jgi:hypothetical protein
LETLVSQGSKAGDNLVSLVGGDSDRVILGSLVELDHSGVSFTVVDGRTFDKYRFNIAAVDFVDVHGMLVNGENESLHCSRADELQTDPALSRINFNNLV